MKLKNKKTGEIGRLITHDWLEDSLILSDDDGVQLAKYASLADLVDEWEDYEEPKGYWSYDTIDNDVTFNSIANEDDRKADQEIGNYFETREEAEKAVEKLKAWKRLEDIYFIRFDLDFVKNTISFTYRIDGTLHSSVDEERIVFEDLKTIFGGEE